MNSLLPLLLVAGLACVYGANIDAVLCGPMCMMYCPYGNVLNDNGCPLCKCSNYVGFLVESNNRNIVNSRAVIGCDWHINFISDPAPELSKLTTAKACPQVMCMIYCPSGNLLGSDGCPQCACN
ncbi:antistasin-like [Ylistrum balloti]|uniref:antistasin-like n=1 Tax=Ylistrum balloti TaxID=509963 RepID=UPI002905F5DD|nr:antistasin-like [Ylistrum balloti]